MKENKEKKVDGNTHQKAGWMIGFALIIFLVLLFGGLIVMKMVRDQANTITKYSNNIGDLAEQLDAHYDVLSDGTRTNKESGVVDAEIVIGTYRFNQFSIVENSENPDGNGSPRTEIGYEIENISDAEVTDAKTFLIRLYGMDDEVLTEFSIEVSGLPPHMPTAATHITSDECVEAVRMDVTEITIGLSEDAAQPAE